MLSWSCWNFNSTSLPWSCDGLMVISTIKTTSCLSFNRCKLKLTVRFLYLNFERSLPLFSCIYFRSVGSVFVIDWNIYSTFCCKLVTCVFIFLFFCFIYQICQNHQPSISQVRSLWGDVRGTWLTRLDPLLFCVLWACSRKPTRHWWESL